MANRRFYIQLAVILGLFIVAPFILTKYYRQFLTEILIWGLLAMSLDLILGYTGIVSFGHAALFGLGAYGAAMAVVKMKAGFWLAMACGLTSSILFATSVGFLSIYVRGIYFTIITLVSAEIFHTVMLATPFFGGENGLNYQVPSLNLGFVRFSLLNPTNFYYLVLFFFLLSYFLCRRVTQSPVGKVFQAIKDNEERARAVGYDVRKYKIMAFVISGLFSGLSGVLYTLLNRYSNPDFLSFNISGEAVIWTLIGGMGTLYGPVLGTAIVMIIGDSLSSWIENYLIIIGLMFIVSVIFLPKGIVGTITDRFFLKGRMNKDWKDGAV
ncbi:MAG: branched-chain amino acid ABC transporter permease [Thermodesulfobacteriota bacterium]